MTGRARALVVDDVPSFGLYLKHVLRVEEVDADVVTDVAAAERAMLERTYDLFLLDSVLANGESGYSILSRVRAGGATAQAPVIMVTGEDGGDAAVAKGLRAGADDYVTKPLDEGLLRSRVRAALRAGSRRTTTVSVDERARTSRLHRSGLPVVPYLRGRMAVSGEVLARTDLSGDLFDIVEDGSGRTSAVLIDAAGHGTAAALVATAVRADLRSRLAEGRSLQECVQGVARAMSAMANDLVPSAAIGIVRVAADGATVECLNAGLPPIVVAGAELCAVEAQFPALGRAPVRAAPTATLPITGDTVLLLVSDGLDAQTIGEAGFERLQGLIDQHGTRLALARANELRELVLDSAGLVDETADDAAIVVLAVLA